MSYVDGSGAAGDYGTDTLTIGGQTLTGLQFGIGYESTSADGILGIGYAADEAQANTAHLKSYANLPQALVNAGMVKSNAYSLWLDDYQASTGSIIFGGIDIDKYTGRLYTLPIQEEFSEYAEFIITLTSMSIIDSGENQSLDTDLPTAVVLDSGELRDNMMSNKLRLLLPLKPHSCHKSGLLLCENHADSENRLGSSLTYLPNANAIYAALNVEYSQLNGAAFATCNLASENITLDFTFTSATISIPIRELVLSTDSIEEGQEEPSFGRDSYSSRGSDEICLFGIAPSQGSTPVLGDTFLRSAYVVYDLANNEISLAQTNFKSTTTHIVEIGVGTGSVPGAIPVISAVEASVSQSGGPRIAGVSGTVTGGSLATSTNSAESMHVAYGGFAAAAGLWAAVACT